MKSSSDSANDSIAGGHDARNDQWQRHFEERACRAGPEVHRGVLQRPVESAHPSPDGHRDEADLERDVRNQDRGVSRCPAEVEEQSQQRRAKHDLRGRQRKHKERVHGALPPEPLAHKGYGHQGAQHHER